MDGSKAEGGNDDATPAEFVQAATGDFDGDVAEVPISSQEVGEKFRSANIGLSLESSDLADPRLDPAVSNLDEMLSSLGSPALRFGGNALDRRTFWTSTGESPKHSEKVTITPDDLRRLKKLVDATDSTVTMGIPLGTYDPARGADMAAYAVDILGDSLVGLAIGNEPNGYTVEDVPSGAVRGEGWDKEKYLDQLASYVKAIHAKRPEAPIVGPDVYDAEWMEAFADTDIPHTAALSQHWYQLYECDSDDVPGRGPEPQNLVDPTAKKSAEKILGIGRSKAEAAGLPLWLEETGPTSCAGTNDASLTVASALWTADYTLFAATLGVRRMAMHSMLGACNGGAPMSLVCDPADHGQSSNKFEGRPHLPAMRLLVPSIGGTFTKTSVAGGGNMSAYTVIKDDSKTLVTTIINSNDAKHSDGNPVTLKLPAGYSTDGASQIYGPSNEAKDATAVIPFGPLPDQIPYSGPNRTERAGASATADAEDNELNIDIAASSATVFIMRKG